MQNLASELRLEKSKAIMEASRKVFPGGVNSPVRSFSSVGGTPIVFKRGQGKTITDVDGNSYVDFCSSWGPLILGYSHPDVVTAVQNQAADALTFGAPSEHELRLAEKMREWVPQIEMLRFVNSGTEATMSAIRAARAATGRDKILKFVGCYHGHADCLLVAAGSGLATLGEPSSAGVPQGAVADTLTCDYNDEKAVAALFEKHGKNIALVCVEPLAANMGLVLPAPNFLQFLRSICDSYNSLLLFDEVMTGFRLAKGGAAEAFGVVPDLWAFGKIIGGGLPAAAYGGKQEVMKHVSPLGKAYQAGTLSGNPLAMVAGLATLRAIEDADLFTLLEKKGRELDEVVQKRLAPLMEAGKLCYVRRASFFCFFFGQGTAPTKFSEVQACDMEMFSKIYHTLLRNGVYFGPSGYEVGFISAAHETEDFEKLVSIISSVVCNG